MPFEHCHFLRPWWLLMLIPWAIFLWSLWHKKITSTAWEAVCDKHLLPHLIQQKGKSKRRISLLTIFLSTLCIIISLSGPSWTQLPLPMVQTNMPKVIILDLSDSMLIKDLIPDRLSRAKFKLKDILNIMHNGQIGLIAYTSEPFIVSPLTEDAHTIDALLAELHPEIMPVKGNKLESALEEAANLIKQAHFTAGQLLVFTATPPNESALNVASTLATQGIFTSILPFLPGDDLIPLFHPLAAAGKGLVLSLSEKDLKKWLHQSESFNQFTLSKNTAFLWKDEGRWFLIPAALFLLPVFRKNWLQRIKV